MKRANGEGTLRQRPNGVWQARYVDGAGVQRALTRTTQKEAAAAMRTALEGSRQGVRPLPAHTTVADWLELWLADRERALRPATVSSYRETCERYIVPTIGRLRLDRLTPEDVGGMIRALEARTEPRPLSARTVRYAVNILRIALSRAVRSRRLPVNVAGPEYVDAPKPAPHELHPLTAAQVLTFLASVRGTRDEALYVTALGTGARQGELLGLMWADVDLEARTMRIRQTLQRGTRTVAEPKTAGSRRTLALAPSVVTALRELREANRAEGRPIPGPGAFVFALPDGRPFDSVNVTHDLADAPRPGEAPPPAVPRPPARFRDPTAGGGRRPLQRVPGARPYRHRHHSRHLCPLDRGDGADRRRPRGGIPRAEAVNGAANGSHYRRRPR